LAREPVYSTAIVIGLAVGFAACFLLLALVRYAFTYNDAIADSQRIWMVKERRNILPRPDWRADGPAPLNGVAAASGLAVATTTAKEYDLTARVGTRFVPLTVQVAAPNYLDFFGIRALEGDAGAALRRPDALVLSESAASRMFGQPHALGKVAYIDGQAFEVKAILRDMPDNTSVGMEALVGAGAHSWAPPPKDPWFATAAVYVKGAPGLQARNLASMLQDAVTRQLDAKLPLRLQKAAKGALPTEIAVVRLPDVYFDPDLLASRSGQRYGSKAGVMGLGVLALLILGLAVANYVNLAAIRTVARQREIGMRKALGVTSRGLASQFMAESLVVAMAATVAGLVIAWLALPLFSELVGRKLGAMLSTDAVLTMLLAGALTGVLAGV
jgi:hypothetical protein